MDLFSPFSLRPDRVPAVQAGPLLLPDPAAHEEVQGRLPHMPPLQPSPARREEKVLQMTDLRWGSEGPAETRPRHRVSVSTSHYISRVPIKRRASANRLGVVVLPEFEFLSHQARPMHFFKSMYSFIYTACSALLLFFSLNEGLYINTAK